jgi:hypothetical protein
MKTLAADVRSLLALTLLAFGFHASAANSEAIPTNVDFGNVAVLCETGNGVMWTKLSSCVTTTQTCASGYKVFNRANCPNSDTLSRNDSYKYICDDHTRSQSAAGCLTTCPDHKSLALDASVCGALVVRGTQKAPITFEDDSCYGLAIAVNERGQCPAQIICRNRQGDLTEVDDKAECETKKGRHSNVLRPFVLNLLLLGLTGI